MHLYSAIITAAPGKVRPAREVMKRLRDVAISVNGLPTSAWAVVAGAPFGSFAFSAQIEGTQQLLGALTALGASDDWNTASEESASLFVGPAEIIYNQVIATTTDGVSGKPLISVTRAVIAPGHINSAIESAVEILNFVGDKTNLDGVLTISAAGQMNELNWVFGLESGEEADAAMATLAADAQWVDLQDRAGPYTQASGDRMLLARLD